MSKNSKSSSVACLLVVLMLTAPCVLLGEASFEVSVVRLTSGGQTGTGFVVAVEGGTAFIATAKHVVSGSKRVFVDFPSDRSRKCFGEILQNDLQEDLALLRVEDAPPGLEPLAIDEEPSLGEFATVVGFPRRALVPRPVEVTLSSREGTRLILAGQVDFGNSGSPLVQVGNVVGLVLATKRGYAEAIPGSTLREALDSWLPGLLPQAQFETSEIHGRIYWIDEDQVTRHHEEDLSVRILETGETGRTDNVGYFRLPSPPNPPFRPGFRITIVVGKDGWVIRYPFIGKLQIPALPQTVLFDVELVPKGSKALLSDGHIEKLVEQAARQLFQASEEAKDEPTRYIEEWAAAHGLGIDEVRREIERWSDEILQSSEDAHQRGLAEFAKERFLAAQASFDEAVQGWRAELETLSKQRERLRQREEDLKQRLVRDLELAASS